MTDRAEWAVAYAAAGFHVFPCHVIRSDGTCSCAAGRVCDSPGKHPACRNGVLDATDDAEVIEKVWERYDWNIGLATGHRFDVLDLDAPEATLGLEAAIREHEPDWDVAELGRFDPPMVITGKGMHVYFQPVGNNRARLAPQVDWRGKGGYVVAPPSVHPSGAEYHWTGCMSGATSARCAALWEAIPPAPVPLVRMVRREGPWERLEPDPVPVVDRSDILARLDVERAGTSGEGLVLTMAEAVQGERNHVMFWCLCRAFTDYLVGRVDAAELEKLVNEIQEAAHENGLGRHEIDKSTRSAYRTVIERGSEE